MKILRISAFSHKGGVGRTTICFGFFNRLITLATKRPDVLSQYKYDKIIFWDWDKQANLLRLVFRHLWDGKSSFSTKIGNIEIQVLSGFLHKHVDDDKNTLIIDDCSPSIEILEKESFMKESDKIICPVNGKLSMYGLEDVKYVFDRIGWSPKKIYMIPMNVPRSFRWTENYLRQVISVLNTHENNTNDSKEIIVMGDDTNLGSDDTFKVEENKKVLTDTEFIYSDRNFSRSELLGASVFGLPYAKRSVNVLNLKSIIDLLLFGKSKVAELFDLWV